MTYSVYLGNTLAIENLSKEEAEQKVEEFRKMIFVGVRSDYTSDDIKMKEE
jgi:hypothetical protein